MDEIYVERKGKGTPVLLLHGLLSNHTQVAPLLPALSGCEVFMVDLLGCGKSSKNPSASIVEENVAVLRALCKKQKIKTVIGYSISGIVAIQLHLPNTILVSTFCKNPFSEGPFKPLHGKEEKIEQFLLKYPHPIHSILSKVRQSKVPGVAEASMECAINYMMAAKRDYTAEAKKLKHTLVLHGTKDQLINYKLGEILAQATSAPCILVPADHASILHNKIVHEQIRSFIAEVE